jgi:hypothetical protein
MELIRKLIIYPYVGRLLKKEIKGKKERKSEKENVIGRKNTYLQIPELLRRR